MKFNSALAKKVEQDGLDSILSIRKWIRSFKLLAADGYQSA